MVVFLFLQPKTPVGENTFLFWAALEPFVLAGAPSGGQKYKDQVCLKTTSFPGNLVCWSFNFQYYYLRPHLWESLVTQKLP